MTFRKSFLAAVLAAAAVPTFAHAAPYLGIGERQQAAQLGRADATAAHEAQPTESKPTDGRWVDTAALQQRGELGRGNGTDGRTAAFFDEHQKAMNVGVSHIEASELAARNVAKAER